MANIFPILLLLLTSATWASEAVGAPSGQTQRTALVARALLSCLTEDPHIAPSRITPLSNQPEASPVVKVAAQPQLRLENAPVAQSDLTRDGPK